MTKDQYYVLRGFTRLGQDERNEVVKAIEQFENGNNGEKQLLYALWHISSVGIGLDLETKSNGPMATAIDTNVCPCCKR